MTPRDLDRAAVRIQRHQRRTERQRKRVLLAVVDASPVTVVNGMATTYYVRVTARTREES